MTVANVSGRLVSKFYVIEKKGTDNLRDLEDKSIKTL